MNDEKLSSTSSDIPPRRRWLPTLRRRSRGVGSVAMGSSERNSWRMRYADSRRSLIDDLQASVLIQLGLGIRAYREGEPLKAIRHLSKAAEAISVMIESVSSPAEEVSDESGS